MSHAETIIAQTVKWINDIVIGCNFCPFAARVVKEQKVHYQVEGNVSPDTYIRSFLEELTRLDEDAGIETSFLIFSEAFVSFDDYLDFVTLAENLLKKEGYEGIYQLASFHPQYRFAGVPEEDAANYTNRSVYPMLHLLREASIDKALEYYKHPEQIPERNIHFAREKGFAYMKMLRDNCF
jgi:uncharacterized protein